MESFELYGRLLDILSPWFVSGVDYEPASDSIVVRVELEQDPLLACPICGSPCNIYDTRDERRWRHLDWWGHTTFLSARIPRVWCSEHKAKTISVPWSEPHSRFTLDFERHVIKVLQQTKSQVRAARITRLSSDQIHDIMHRAVDRGLARRSQGQKIVNLSLDEKGFKRGKHFVSVLTDLDNVRVLDLCEDRTIQAVSSLIKATLTKKQLKGVRCVTMDMWDGFIAAVRGVLPKADIVFDRFHIARYLGEAVDKTRIAENKKLAAQGDGSLKGSKFFWVSRPENLHAKLKEKYDFLLGLNLETGKAWALKEMFRHFFEQKGVVQGKAFFEQWLQSVAELGNVHLKKVAKMLKRYYYGLEAYLKHKTTNSKAEGTNALIQEIKITSRGYRTFQGFRVAILFFLAKLDLYPQKCR